MKELLRRFVRTCVTLFLRLGSRTYSPASGARCVIIAPHQDDEALGCAGLIYAHRQAQLQVDVVYVTDGSGSHSDHPRLTPADIARLRRSEATYAMQRLGVDPDSLHFIDATDGTLTHLSASEAEAIIRRLSALLAALRPTELLLPCHKDGSSEHTASFTLTLQAIKQANLEPRVLEYPIWARWSPLRLLRPWRESRRVYSVSFPREQALKRTVLNAYASQTEPTAPWPRPVLPAGFVDCFDSPHEFFFEY